MEISYELPIVEDCLISFDFSNRDEGSCENSAYRDSTARMDQRCVHLSKEAELRYLHDLIEPATGLPTLQRATTVQMGSQLAVFEHIDQYRIRNYPAYALVAWAMSSASTGLPLWIRIRA